MCHSRWWLNCLLFMLKRHFDVMQNSGQHPFPPQPSYPLLPSPSSSTQRPARAQVLPAATGWSGVVRAFLSLRFFKLYTKTNHSDTTLLLPQPTVRVCDCSNAGPGFLNTQTARGRAVGGGHYCGGHNLSLLHAR